MVEQLFYREKGLFLQRLHPVTALTYLGVLFVLALASSNPLYLTGVLVVVVLGIWAADGLEAWEGYLRIILGMALLIMIVNPLVIHAGKTVLWLGPRLPVFGRLTISLEAVCYGAAMSVRLLDVVSIFCLYNLVVHPDKPLRLLSRFAGKSALVASLAVRMFPSMLRELQSIREVQCLRGVDFAAGGMRERIKKYAFLLRALLLTALEGSLETAESMQARAFGSGPRTRYHLEVWRPRDTLCLTVSLLVLAVAAYGGIKGFTGYVYYPRLGSLLPGGTALAALVAVFGGLLFPVALGWGWRRWPYLRSKI